MSKAKGTVKWFNATKGFGFIVPEKGGDDVFVHANQIQNSGLTSLKEGDNVEYDITEGNNGRSQAENIGIL